ncbi:hypothetical protein A2U01_0084765, partial [Trifolium medium]|nr:hypothetical protein [Trifolium medium]
MPATRPSSDLILHRFSSDYEIKLRAIGPAVVKALA